MYALCALVPVGVCACEFVCRGPNSEPKSIYMRLQKETAGTQPPGKICFLGLILSDDLVFQEKSEINIFL